MVARIPSALCAVMSEATAREMSTRVFQTGQEEHLEEEEEEEEDE